MLKVGLILFSLMAAVDWQDELRQIDQQIEQLQDLQDKYRSSAKRNADNAMRWQFQSENYLDARRAWEKSAQDKQKVKEIQDQMDDLQKRKQKILKEHEPKKSS